MAENFPNLIRNTNLEIQEAEQSSKQYKLKRSLPTHSISKLFKTKDKE